MSRRPMNTPQQDESTVKIVVIEDSVPVREVLVEQLNEIPRVRVVGTADSERAALETIRATPCDILIVDIGLRAGTGLEVLRALVSDPPPLGAPATKIVFTNYTESEFRKLAERYEAQYFFDKSTGFTSLIDTVSRLAADA